MDRINLNDEWTLHYGPQTKPASELDVPFDLTQWKQVVASVPGNVELDLIRAGLLPEDLDREHNIYKLREIETFQWWFSRTFEMGARSDGHQFELVLEGVDTLATVWLNGRRIATLDNMLIPHRIDVSGKLLDGTNEIVIAIDSTVLAAQETPVDPGTWAMENNWESLSIRKAAHSFGWDIMPRAVSAGLWRDVYIETIPTNRFRSVYLATTAVDVKKRTAQFAVRWDIAVNEWPVDLWSVRMTITSVDDGRVIKNVTAPVLATHGSIPCDVENVNLWWPRGAGEAALYDVRLELVDSADKQRARWQTRYGFRTVKLKLTDTTDADGNGDFSFVVNGERLFIKGSNWVPLDAFHSRDAERLDATFELVADLNCNMIRCWGGNVYESNAFFRKCDEAGVMVWQDFAFACALYPQTPEFHQKVRAEADAIIPLLRNHPSLVLWAGNNEIDAFYSFAKPGSDPNVDDKISREVLASACRRLDPWRDYLPSSPYFSSKLWSLGAPHEARPEDHLWGPRDDFKGSFYLSSNAHFASEIGYHGCPDRSSLERMITPENLWPWQDNEEWLTHAVRPQLRGTAYNYRIQLMANQISVLFGSVPDNLDDFIFASQVSQAEALKFFIERFRIAKGRRTGILWWNIRDGWPEISDAVVDYYGARKLAYHVVKRVQQDVCVMIDEAEAGAHTVVAVNDTLEPVEIDVSVTRDDREVLARKLSIPANGKVAVGEVPTADEASFYLLRWSAGDKTSRNHYLAGPRPFSVGTCNELYESLGLSVGAT